MPLAQVLKDFFGPRQPCDLCQLGRAEWERSGSVELKVSAFKANDGHVVEVDAELLICHLCAGTIEAQGWLSKNPLYIQQMFILNKVMERPDIEVVLKHPQWEKIWRGNLQSAGIKRLDVNDSNGVGLAAC